MSAKTAPPPLVRNHEAAERRWFYGGGVYTWLAKAEDTGGEFLLCEVQMTNGKVTPLHTHPADETLYLLQGELLMHIDGQEFQLAAGGVAFAPRGVPHAFKVMSESCTVLCLHTPGTCEAFYMGASEPIDADTVSGPVDFDRIAASGQQNGGIEILGPPPFQQS